MISEVRFIHVADLHLGAPIRGLRNVTPEWAGLLQSAIAEAYDRVIDAALANEVDFVVLAGDAFDTSRPSYADYLRFFDGVERLSEAGIPLYLIAGNHDPFTTWARDVERLPESVKLLGVNGPEFTLFSRDNEPVCLIGARSYYNQSWAIDEKVSAGIGRSAAIEALGPEAAKAPFMIGLIHTGLDIDMAKAASDEADLMAADVDYWACGHLHGPLVRPSETDPRIVFPGCVQGRDIKESGERGCFLVKLSTNEKADKQPGTHPIVQLEFIPTSNIVLQQLSIDVSACQTLTDAARLIQARLFHENGKVFCDEMVVRIVLTGATDLHGFLQQQRVVEHLRKQINDAYPSFFCDAIVNRTEPKDASPSGSSFPAIVVDMANEQRDREDVLINYVQNEFIKRGLVLPSALSRRIDVFNDDAEMLVLDLLRENEEGDDL